MSIRDYQIIFKNENGKYIFIVTPFEYNKNLLEYHNMIEYLKHTERDIKKYFETKGKKNYSLSIKPIYKSNSYY